MFNRLIAVIICCSVVISAVQPVSAQEFNVNQLPVPGSMVGLSPSFVPLALKGIVVDPKKPLEFQFIVDTGLALQDTAAVKEQANELLKYFLAGLTIPEEDLWVNLSPYEKDRMTSSALGSTGLGRDLLAQDYILKQLTASLIYPEKDLGKEFWSRVYKKAQDVFGTTDIPLNTFNKVWIVPHQAQVFEKGSAAYITQATLKVMLEQDYLALNKQKGTSLSGASAIGADIVREIIIPEIEREVNSGKNFASLRQMYQALILAKWYKETIQNALLDAVYTDKTKIKGINLSDSDVKEKIYARYLEAYKKGVFNYIKDADPKAESAPKKYFSGGLTPMPKNVDRSGDAAMVAKGVKGELLLLTVSLRRFDSVSADDAQYDIDRMLKPVSDFAMFGQRYNQELSKLLVLDSSQITFQPVIDNIDLGNLINTHPWSSLAVSIVSISLIYYVWTNYTLHGIRLELSEGGDAGKLKNYLRKKNYHQLIKLLKDPSVGVRMYVVRRLGELGDVRAIVPILESLQFYNSNYGQDSYLLEFELALSRLGVSQEQLISGYISAVMDSGSALKSVIIKKLLGVNNEQVVNLFLQLLKDKKGISEDVFYEMQEKYLLSGKNVDKDRLVDAYVSVLSSDNEFSVMNAVRILGTLGDASAIGPLKELLTEGAKIPQIYVLMTLALLGDVDVVESLLENMKSNSSLFREIENILIKLNIGDVLLRKMYVIGLFVCASWDRERVANKLISLGGYEHEDVLKKLLERRPPGIRIDVMQFLEQAIEYKAKGNDFKLVYTPEQTHTVEGVYGYNSGYQSDGHDPYSGASYVETVIDTTEKIEIFPIDNAMLQISQESVRGDKAQLSQYGGIDLNQISIKRTGNPIKIDVDPAQLNALMQGGFEGFSPVIISMTPIQSPYALLGVDISK